MKARDLELAERVAVALADDLQARIPAAFSAATDELLAVTWPLALRLVCLERKAKKNKKHAKAYRRVRREVRELLAVRATCPAPQAAPAPWLVPYDPGDWRVALVPRERHREASRLEAA